MADEFFRPFFSAASGRRANSFPASGTRRCWGTTTASSASSRVSWTGSSRPAARCGGCPRRRSSARGAPTATGNGTRRWRRASASRRLQPRTALQNSAGGPDNTTLRLADSVNVFETGALATGVTVDRVDYRILSFDAGMKYKGFFLQTEIYNRWLDNFKADGALPVGSIHDTASMCRRRSSRCRRSSKLYGATSQIYGDKTAGFGNSSEYLVGMNYYPFNTRNHRLNMQVIDVNGSPVSSAFGYYVGGQRARRSRPHSPCSSRGEGVRVMTTQFRLGRSWPWFAGVTSLVLLIAVAVPLARPARRNAAGRAGQPYVAARRPLAPHQLHPGRADYEGLPEGDGRQGRPRRGVRPAAPADVGQEQLGRFRPDLLPADRRAALLLLVHRRLARDAVQGR